jgi:hypothetical protein
MTGFKWTPDIEAEFRRLWEAKTPTHEIMAIFGKTRSSILGKAHRMGMYRGVVNPMQTMYYREKQYKPRRDARGSDIGLHVEMMELGYGMCRFPTSEKPYKFCGLTCEGTYCVDHKKLTYVERVGKVIK